MVYGADNSTLRVGWDAVISDIDKTLDATDMTKVVTGHGLPMLIFTKTVFLEIALISIQSTTNGGAFGITERFAIHHDDWFFSLVHAMSLN
jgi:hypothetical protein